MGMDQIVVFGGSTSFRPSRKTQRLRFWGGLSRLVVAALSLAVFMAPVDSLAVSPAPVQRVVVKLGRSPAIRNAIKRLPKNPAGMAVALIIAAGAWIGSELFQKIKSTKGHSRSSGKSVPTSAKVNHQTSGDSSGTAGPPGHGTDVGVGVVAPATAIAGETVMVQVAVDFVEGLAESIEKAKHLDAANHANERGSLVLRNVADGAFLQFQLDMPELVVDDSIQDHVWDGTKFILQFFASVPDGSATGTRPAKLLVSVDGRPVGRIGFVLNVVLSREEPPKPAEMVPHGYSQYFVSYSDKDLDRVIPRVQGLRIAELDRNIHFFFDKASLVPGEPYEAKIFDYIDNRADAFLLFWSENSAASEWVEKEWRRALYRQKEKDGLPDIIPVPLDRDAPPPPKELSNLHFGDSLLFFSTSRKNRVRARRHS